MRGRIRRRLALALVLTALIPVCAAIWLSRSMLRQSTDRFFLPEIGQRLEQSIELYQELANAIKARMRANTETIAGRAALHQALDAANLEALGAVLREELARYPDLASLVVRDENESTLAEVDRGHPVNPEHELQLVTNQPLPSGATLQAVFATSRARFDELEGMGRFVDTYRQVAQRREADEKTYVYAFAALLGLTIVAAVGVGSSLARGVSHRLARLADATLEVGKGDLSLRVAVGGNDEISDLARAFNHMLGEVQANRARIEYLQQLATWQGMARRLAHEIKNPLTPIQLAVQEVHQRYTGTDPAYRQAVNTMLEVVEAEVGTLRRLCTEFSDFARLPKAKLAVDDLYDFLRSLRGQEELAPDHDPRVRLEFDIPPSEVAPVCLDRQMFRRVLINLINNAIQATRELAGERRIRVGARAAGKRWLHLYVEDDGPGIPEALRPTIFDPYVTHTSGGTGLGLAIVKKIVVEHGGTIEVDSSPLGGARMSISLPSPSLAESVRTPATQPVEPSPGLAHTRA